MDPQIEWERLIRSYARRDWANVEKVASGLLYWLEHGGTPPAATGQPVENTWDWAVARYACEFSLIQAREHRGLTAGTTAQPRT